MNILFCCKFWQNKHLAQAMKILEFYFFAENSVYAVRQQFSMKYTWICKSFFFSFEPAKSIQLSVRGKFKQTYRDKAFQIGHIKHFCIQYNAKYQRIKMALAAITSTTTIITTECQIYIWNNQGRKFTFLHSISFRCLANYLTLQQQKTINAKRQMIPFNDQIYLTFNMKFCSKRAKLV